MIEHPMLDSSSVLTKSFSSFSNNKIKKYLMVVLVILLLVGVGVGFSWWQDKKNAKEEVATDIQKLNIETAVIPDGIPQNLPFIGQGRVLYNYVADAPTGTHFSVRKWEADGTRKIATQEFKKFLETGGWQILTFAEQENFVLLGASLNGTTLSLVLSSGVDSNHVLIEAGSTSMKAN